MAAKKKASKAQKAAMKARYNPYVQKVIDDEDLRDSIVEAFESLRAVYGRLSNGKSPADQIFDDKKLHKHVKNASGNIRDAAVSLHDAPRKQRKGGIGRLLLLGIVGGGVALVASEGLRKKVLDTLFGAEEEFEYTSTTSAPTNSDAASASASTTTGPAPTSG
jgi:hypothetical protein